MPPMPPISSRIRAFLLHLSASAILGLSALALVFWIWYPAPLHRAVGVTEIFLLLLGVDVVLGPCLTLAVANPGKKKKELLFDLSLIIAVQLSAFVYGLHAVAEGRPVWLVLNTDRVDLVRVLEIDERQLDQALPEYRQAPWSGPEWVFAPMPEDIETRNTLTLESAFGASDIYQRPQFYRPLPEGNALLNAKALPLENLKNFNAEAEVRDILAVHPDADAWLPLRSNRLLDMVVLVNRKDARVVSIVNLRPWY
ncbi:fimb protein [Betaproteobacteria bacterium]|nr:fimb protein [Betaproteobacteria bacterium]